MDERCCDCGCELTAKNTMWSGYRADRFGIIGELCDRCSWLRDKYDTERANGEHDEY